MANLNDVTKLRAKVDSLRAKAEQAKGAAQVVRKTLIDKWGCKSLKEAKILLEEKKEEAQGLKEDFDSRLDAFKVEWAEELDAV